MEILSTFAGTRRSRRQQAFWRAIRWGMLALCIVGGSFGSYRVGVSKSRAEVERLEHDLSAMRELNRQMSERIARAEQQAEGAITRYAQLQQTYRNEVPRGELRQLVDLIDQRLRQGVPAARLRFVLQQATTERRCDKEVETKRVPVHTPTSTGAVSTVGFAENRITVSGEGSPARTAEGKPEPFFDPGQPVTLRFLEIDGDVGTIEGTLPLTHAVVLGSNEYLFAIKASDKQQGQIDVTVQRCAFP
ncbi:hypothetical protein [Benzoatithermus flavus]|uniref:Uncharacterized protein n=1 Tax=Benzoatithermus flavus TaxID=3108223 RepID=A0ABU8XWX2_9PROT